MTSTMRFDQWQNSLGVNYNTVIQTVMSSTATAISTSSLDWQNTNLSASIIPKFATSKILIIVADSGKATNPANWYESWFEYGIFRDGISTALVQSMNGLSTGSTSSGVKTAYTNLSMSFLDSPATTSTITYRTKFKADLNSGSQSVSVHKYTDYSSATIEGSSQIILMEIAQ